jgi:hypothetical protein
LFSIQIQMTCWNVEGAVSDVPHGPAAEADVTTAVCAEVALLEPTELDAVMRTRIVEPTSFEVSR